MVQIIGYCSWCILWLPCRLCAGRKLGFIFAALYILKLSFIFELEQSLHKELGTWRLPWGKGWQSAFFDWTAFTSFGKQIKQNFAPGTPPPGPFSSLCSCLSEVGSGGGQVILKAQSVLLLAREFDTILKSRTPLGKSVLAEVKVYSCTWICL